MNIDKTEDKRRFHRIVYHAAASLSNAEHTIPCKIVDLSLKGCLLEFTADDLEPIDHDPMTLTMALSDETVITMDLTACHKLDNKVGFKCEKIDIDSISELRRLIELNLGDSSLLERDIQALMQ